MTFSSVFKAMIVSSVFISTASLSADLGQTKQQVQRLSKELSHSYHGQIALEDFEVDAIKHQFIFGHGIVLTITTNIDELTQHETVSQQQHTKEQPSLVLINEKAEDKTSKQTLNKLRFQARNIAHQEFSLQKQIDSMQSQSLQSQTDQQKDAIDKKIRIKQDRMRSLVTEKAQVSKAIASYSKVVEQNSEQRVKTTRDEIYTKLVKQSYYKLCNDLAFIEQLANNEQLTLVFEGLGDIDAAGHKDKMINIEKATLTQCHSGEISAEQAFKQSYSYQY